MSKLIVSYEHAVFSISLPKGIWNKILHILLPWHFRSSSERPSSTVSRVVAYEISFSQATISSSKSPGWPYARASTVFLSYTASVVLGWELVIKGRRFNLGITFLNWPGQVLNPSWSGSWEQYTVEHPLTDTSKIRSTVLLRIGGRFLIQSSMKVKIVCFFVILTQILTRIRIHMTSVK